MRACSRSRGAPSPYFATVVLSASPDQRLLSVVADLTSILLLGAVTLSQQKFDHQEGFVLSRINGQWDVRSILKLCPMPEEEALMIFVRLVDRKVIELT